MNAIVALCHFCEVHGPRVLFCTQAFHSDGEDNLLDSTLDDGASSSGWSFRGKYPRPASAASGDGTSSAPATPTGTKTTDFCEACRSAVSSGHRGYVSYDTAPQGSTAAAEGTGTGGNRVVYVSSHQAHHQTVFAMVRTACLRSLSCEICPGKEGPIFFGDDNNGYVFSYTFYVKNSMARGFQSWYSIIVIMMDKIYLLNSWPFLVTYVPRIIDGIQASADAVYSKEHVRQPPVPPPHRLAAMNAAGFRQVRGKVEPARSILELTNDKAMFRKLHQAFTWLLKSGGNRLKEILLEGPPTEDSVIDLENDAPVEETEDGFVILGGQQSTDTEDMDLVEKDSMIREEAEDDLAQYDSSVPSFKSLRHMMEVLGHEKFHALAHHCIIGNQVILRCAHRPLLNSLIDVLKTLLPKGCCKVIGWSTDGYQDSWRCNFLGMPPRSEIPGHVDLYVLVDIEVPDHINMDKPFLGFKFTIESPLKLPEKAPSVLDKIEEALLNKKMADSVVDQCIICLKEEWMNKVKVRFMFTKAGAQSVDIEVRKLLPILGAGREDIPVLHFWMTGLSVQYKRHMLGSAKGMKT